MRLEHIGIAVSDIDEAIETFSRILDTTVYKTEHVSRESIKTHFLWVGGVKLELLESTSPDSAVARFIEKRGEGVHHLAFDVESLDAASERLTSLGFHIVADGAEDGADGKRIFFLHPREAHGVLIECCAPIDRGPEPVESHDLKGRARVRVFGSSQNPAVILIGIADDKLAISLLRRLEPTAHIVFAELTDDENLNNSVMEIVVARTRHTSSHVMTVGSSCRLAGALVAGSAASWIRVELHSKPMSVHEPKIPNGLLITSHSYAAVEGWYTVVLPEHVVNPDNPELDALVPMIRAHWSSAG